MNTFHFDNVFPSKPLMLIQGRALYLPFLKYWEHSYTLGMGTTFTFTFQDSTTFTYRSVNETETRAIFNALLRWTMVPVDTQQLPKGNAS